MFAPVGISFSERQTDAVGQDIARTNDGRREIGSIGSRQQSNRASVASAHQNLRIGPTAADSEAVSPT